MTSSGPPSTSSATDDASSMLELESLVDAATFDDKVCLEDFTLIRVIGKGSFGKVTLVRKTTNSKIFAMKILSKSHLLKRKQVEHTKTERRVLSVASHPFIVGLHYAFQTQAKLYFVLDYCPGGELFFHLSRMGKFDEKMAKFYAAELVVALEHLHSLGVVYRDLKPENILLDEMGHIKLADFGLAKDEVTEIDSGATSLCGTPEYLAPEVLARKGHGTAVDWWGLGMVLYEMLTGLPPWYTRNRQELFARIREAPLEIPKYLSADAASLISHLLHREPEKRLGSRGASEVKAHRFFRSVDWDGLLWSEPPFKPSDPQSKEAGDTSNFDKEFTELPVTGTPLSKSSGGSALPRSMFTGFTYEAPNFSFGSDTSQSKVDVSSTPYI
ncbi:Agc protein kinase, partial [Globisporangium splendens]|uniref:Protein kinase domain-containing protein n=1 Tax=Globisporangium ultimum (strain ATCC 200006 / CBS 805.95 / DAOM BR144) TaxID=431595 RepID=K3WTR9_GLOUD